ncbi:oxygen-independent coproporphyrinogen III oxidase [Pseudogemmobacter faecipullorum]|uniref:Coproporphyrinogen-III oxidase n=1 Tax=Pseudogemmobacter faecipullorum TaxID=2755041 RepID=A0ABS8CJE6_9RHOB|nr:oxygen-independent coproporphyrinogen III oxidase [Pseudogemmobacter faecipullorum]MCB5409524.1 oxygen-independent coproporphyrinogen III oxidase [Pseudogemmobacter faecipullorum]
MQINVQLSRLGLFDARVPRYTSYPTAPHFSAAVGADDLTGWIRAVRPGSQISLYLHVPFCRRLCWFCACRTQGTSSEDPVIAYAETLRREIDHLVRYLPEGVTLSRLHWGGGTPTLLPPDQIRSIAGSIARVLPMAPGGEFSVEIDPNEADPARLDALAGAGMNRASIGVQDFDPEIQTAIGRDQSYELTLRIAEGLRARGITSLNCDILYGLPHQTRERISDSVQKLLSLSPDRVALYGYAHVPWMSRRQQLIPSDSLPTPEERLALFETARQLFAADGYDQIGIDHFALPTDGLARAAKAGQLRRNFQGYTDDQAEVLIGIGASSISRFPQGYAQNAPATASHTKAIRAGRFSVAKGHVFTAEDRLRGRIIEALMCDFRVSREALVQETGAAPGQIDSLFAGVVAQFEDMLLLQEGVLTIPERARPLTRIIARAFDSYDSAGAGARHSAAV